MIIQAFKKIWKNKRRSRNLLFEFFLSFILLFALLSLIGKLVHNNNIPLGFEYKNVWSGIMEPGVQLSDSAEMEIKKEIFKSITNHQEVLALTQQANNIPFVRNKTYTNHFEYNDLFLGKIFSYAVDDAFDDVFNTNIIEGRWFNKADNASRLRPIVISKSLRDQLGKDNVIGTEAIFHHKKEECRIVGVIDNFKHSGEYSSAENQVFFRSALTRNPDYKLDAVNEGYDANSQSVYNQRIFIKVQPGSGLKLEEKIQDNLAAQFPDWKFRFLPLEKQRKEYLQSFWMPIVFGSIISLFLVFNVIIGLFAVLWYNINHRKAEIGVRVANGATTKHIYQQFMAELLWLSALGILPAIIITSQFPVMGVFDVESGIYILAMLTTVVLIFSLVLLSSILPCRQAARIHPANALRDE